MEERVGLSTQVVGSPPEGMGVLVAGQDGGLDNGETGAGKSAFKLQLCRLLDVWPWRGPFTSEARLLLFSNGRRSFYPSI